MAGEHFSPLNACVNPVDVRDGRIRIGILHQNQIVKIQREGEGMEISLPYMDRVPLQMTVDPILHVPAQGFAAYQIGDCNDTQDYRGDT
jgi:hypothetical protein